MTQQTTHLWEEVASWLKGLDFAPSQSRLAERVGVARSAVSAWKFGKAYPTPTNLAVLARVMDSAEPKAVYERLLEATLRDQGYVPMPEEGGGAHAGSAAPNTPPDESPATELIVKRYLKQADGNPAVAASLLAHDGAKGANTDDDTWLAALERLADSVPAAEVADLPDEIAARRNKKRPPQGPGEQRGD